MIGIILDIVIVAIIALNVFLCYKKGLVNLAVALIAVVAAIILSVILYKPVTNLVIENTGLDETIEKTLNDTFGENVRFMGLASYLDTEMDNIANGTENETEYVVASVMAEKTVSLIVFIAIFIAVRVALFALTFLTDAITSLPLLKQLNEVGGIIYGLAKSLIIIYVVLAIVSVVVSFTANTVITDAISSSFVTKFFYDNNIILNILL